jgi:hypothetical protein
MQRENVPCHKILEAFETFGHAASAKAFKVLIEVRMEGQEIL